MGEAVRYTRAEVAQCTGKNNTPCWLIIKDVVYDVTSYLNEHPDGPKSILDDGGKDATKDFAYHSKDAWTILAKYKIGVLVEEEKHYDENGKKKKRVVSSDPKQNNSRSCTNIITCGLLG